MTSKIINPVTIALQFNDCIKCRDLDNLANLMTEDHIFIDKEDNQIIGKQNCIKAWSEFFNIFPDYKNIFETVAVINNVVIMQGSSRCSDKRLDGKAIWTANIKDIKIAEWRVYFDTIEIRKKLKLIELS